MLLALLVLSATGHAVPDQIGGTSTVQLLADASADATLVRCDLTAIGEAPDQYLFDDGGHGDGAGGDHTFGFVAYVEGGTPIGDKSFPCLVWNATGQRTGFAIALTVIAVCGDGLLQAPEGCDDDGTEDADGCDASCQVELGWICQGEPSTCITRCGDGVVVGDEGCDDANHDPGDGCASCQEEPGWDCTGAPSSCVRVALCGNGVIEAGEQCDDDNMESTDGCDATCTIEDGFTCTGEPSHCCPDTGCVADAGVDAGTTPPADPGCCSTGGGEGSWLLVTVGCLAFRRSRYRPSRADRRRPRRARPGCRCRRSRSRRRSR